jgi:hypothetical protein
MEGDQRIVYAFVYDWQDNTIELPEELGRIAHACVLETNEPVEVGASGNSFRKPGGGLHPDVPVIKMTMRK